MSFGVGPLDEVVLRQNSTEYSNGDLAKAFVSDRLDIIAYEVLLAPKRLKSEVCGVNPKSETKG